MKEKILLALKSARGQNTSTSDRTLDKLASVLSLGIADETAIPNDVELKALIDEITGNISHIAAAAVESAKPTTTVQPAQPAQTVQPVIPAPAFDLEALKAEMAKLMEPLLQKVTGFEQNGKREAVVNQAKQEFYQKYSVNDVEKALCEKALDLHLRVTPTIDTAENLQAGWKTMYEDLRAVQGLGGLTPTGGNNGGGDGGAKTSDFTERLIKLGKIPAPTA